MHFQIFKEGWRPRALPWCIGPLLYHSLIVLAILPVLYLNCYAHPSPADDYYNAVWENYAEAVQRVYCTNNGRFFSTALTTLNPVRWNSIAGYRLGNAAIIACYAWANPWSVSRMLHRVLNLPLGACRLIAVASLVLLLNNMASHTEGFFWLTGAITYTFSVPLLLLLLHAQLQTHVAMTRGRQVACLALIIITTGSNEVALTATGLLLVSAFLFYWKRKQGKYIRFYVWALAVWAICSAIVLLSPGAWARHGGYGASLPSSIASWPVDSLKLLLQWISDPFMLLYAAFVVAVLSQVRDGPATIGLRGAALMPFIIVLLLIAIPYLGIGGLPPPRVLNVVYAAFLLSLLPLLWCITQSLKKLLESVPPASRPFVAQLGVIGFVLALGFSLPAHNLRESNYFLLARNMLHRGPQVYDAGVRERYRQLRRSCADCLVTVPPIPFENGNLLSVGDIRIDTGATRNVVYAQYWHKRAVRISAD